MKILSTTALLAAFSFAAARKDSGDDPSLIETGGNNRGDIGDNVRRIGELGSASQSDNTSQDGNSIQGASSADCTKSMNIQLFSDSANIEFKPNTKVCVSGKTYAGDSDDGKMHITLVSSHADGNPSVFRASVTNDETGAVHSIGADADETMIVTERMPEDYPPELDPENDFDPSERALLNAEMEAGSPQRPQRKDGSISDAGGFLRKIKSVGDDFLAKNPNHGRDLQQSKTVIDVLVAWTREAECQESNQDRGCTRNPTTENNIRRLIDLAIEETNVAYDLSGVNAELFLVHAYQTRIDEEDFPGTGIVRALRFDEEANEKREEFGADTVAMIVGRVSFCGVAYLGPRIDLMYSVTRWSCATGNFSFGHEIGHNFGCEHDRGTKNACNNPNFNYGYRDPGGRFRSILAYTCRDDQCDNISRNGCPRVQRFSNTFAQYEGSPIGNSGANNALQINNRRVEVSNYFERQNPPTPGPTPNLPTQSPTKSPTDSPTNQIPPNSPTTAPTGSPTNRPTLTATATPTKGPFTLSPAFTGPPPCVPLQIDITTDGFPGDISWTLTNKCTGEDITSPANGVYTESNTAYSNVFCMEQAEYTFQIRDAFGDGLCCNFGNGSYSVLVGGAEKASGGVFGSQETNTFGECSD